MLCAYAASVGELIAARALLGVGAAAILPMAMSVIPVMFREEERQRAIAVMASTIFVSYPIGPIVGGLLLDHFWWGSVFLINVPIVAIALVAVAFLMPESRARRGRAWTSLGVLLSSAGLTALTYGFIKAGQDGWTDSVALATLCAGVAGPRGLRPVGARSSRRGAASRSSTWRCSARPASAGARSW